MANLGPKYPGYTPGEYRHCLSRQILSYFFRILLPVAGSVWLVGAGVYQTAETIMYLWRWMQ